MNDVILKIDEKISQVENERNILMQKDYNAEISTAVEKYRNELILQKEQERKQELANSDYALKVLVNWKNEETKKMEGI